MFNTQDPVPQNVLKRRSNRAENFKHYAEGIGGLGVAAGGVGTYIASKKIGAAAESWTPAGMKVNLKRIAGDYVKGHARAFRDKFISTLKRFKFNSASKEIRLASGDIFKKYAPDSPWVTHPDVRQLTKGALARKRNQLKATPDEAAMRKGYINANLGGEHTEYLDKYNKLRKDAEAAKKGKLVPKVRVEGPTTNVRAYKKGSQAEPELITSKQVKPTAKVKSGSKVATERMLSPRAAMLAERQKYAKQIKGTKGITGKMRTQRERVRGAMAEELRGNRDIIQGARRHMGTLPAPMTDRQIADVTGGGTHHKVPSERFPDPLKPIAIGHIPEPWQPAKGGVNIAGQHLMPPDYKAALAGHKADLAEAVKTDVSRKVASSQRLHEALRSRAAENLRRGRATSGLPEYTGEQMQHHVKRILHGIYAATPPEGEELEGIAAMLGSTPHGITRIRDRHMDLARWSKTASGEKGIGKELLKSGAIFKPKPVIQEVQKFPLLGKVPGFGLLKKALRFNASGNAIYFERRKKSFLEKAQSNPSAAADTVYQNIRRGSRLIRDVRLPRTQGGQVTDERGRSRTAEWRKPWAEKALVTAGLAAVLGRKHLAPFTKRVATMAGGAVMNVAKKLPLKVAAREGSAAAEKGIKVPAVSAAFTRAHRTVRAVGAEVRDFRKKVAEKTWDKLPNMQKKVAAEAAKREKAATLDEQKAAMRKIVEGFQSRSSPILFAQTVPNWDVRDARGKSVRVYAPGSQTRERRPKKWHEKKSNRDLIAALALPTATALGGTVAWKANKWANRIKDPKIKPAGSFGRNTAGVVESVEKAAKKIAKPSFVKNFGDRTKLMKFQNPLQKPNSDAPPWHDIATGSVEGAAGVLATDRLIRRFAPEGSNITRKLLIGGTVGGLATGAIGYGLNKLIRQKVQQRRAAKQMDPADPSMNEFSAVQDIKNKRKFKRKPTAPDVGPVPGDCGGSSATLSSRLASIRFAAWARSPIPHKWITLNEYKSVNLAGSKKIKNVKISDLFSDQASIDVDKVAKFRKNKPGSLPTVHRIGDRLQIFDGNHRVAAAMSKGQKRIKVKLIEPARASSAFNSKLKAIRFDSAGYSAPYPPPKGKRITVAQDRYRKQIREKEIDRHESNISKSALFGGALGGAIRHSATGVGVGALAGAGASAILAVRNARNKDVWGDSSISQRRVERLPYQAAAIGAGALTARKVYKIWHGLSSRARLIQFARGDQILKRTPSLTLARRHGDIYESVIRKKPLLMAKHFPGVGPEGLEHAVSETRKEMAPEAMLNYRLGQLAKKLGG